MVLISSLSNNVPTPLSQIFLTVNSGVCRFYGNTNPLNVAYIGLFIYYFNYWRAVGMVLC